MATLRRSRPVRARGLKPLHKPAIIFVLESRLVLAHGLNPAFQALLPPAFTNAMGFGTLQP